LGCERQRKRQHGNDVQDEARKDRVHHEVERASLERDLVDGLINRVVRVVVLKTVDWRGRLVHDALQVPQRVGHVVVQDDPLVVKVYMTAREGL
jgi:hypothetical protein